MNFMRIRESLVSIDESESDEEEVPESEDSEADHDRADPREEEGDCRCDTCDICDDPVNVTAVEEPDETPGQQRWEPLRNLLGTTRLTTPPRS